MLFLVCTRDCILSQHHTLGHLKYLHCITHYVADILFAHRVEEVCQFSSLGDYLYSRKKTVTLTFLLAFHCRCQKMARGLFTIYGQYPPESSAGYYK